MTERNPIERRFPQERLVKLFSQLGTENDHVREEARSKVYNLLQEYKQTWADVIRLLGGNRAFLRADLVSFITAFGSDSAEQRESAYHKIMEVLDRHHLRWNDLVFELCSPAPAAWASHPSADPLERADPLELIVGLLRDFVQFREPHEYIMVALWTIHTHIYSRFGCTPRLVLRSPTAACGKSTLVSIMARLAARAEKFDFITPAALSHVIDERRPTVLIDEADNLALGLQSKGKLGAIFNSGHGSSGTGSIWDSRSGTERKFSTFCPLCLALPDTMGGLPRTLNSRSITINMQRASRELRRLDANQSAPELDLIYGQILAWLRDPDLQLNTDPAMPAGITGRHADNWRPLVAVADSLGHGAMAREAMAIMVRQYRDADAKVELLADVRVVFNASGTDRLPTGALLAALHALDDAGWSEFSGVGGDQQLHKLRPTEMAGMLRAFNIKPRSVWPVPRTDESKSAKGYTRQQFEEAWRLYCTDGTTAHPSNVRSLR